MSNFESPIPLSEIEAVLTWVDTFKLSRPTKKINRDFSDAVLLAEILNVHYPKLVEMHNYPPRNSHALKLNNWMTLNRKVLKKLKINLCCKTMEQLANCAPGIIERVLIMVHDRIKRDEELNKSLKDSEQNVSSGGSYYEACGDDDQILVVPVKTRVNGVLETVHQKVVSHDTYLALKEELKDVKESADVLKQKVEHLDSLLKLKDERIDELQNQLDRKAARRKEVEVFQNSLNVPFDNIVSPIPIKTEDLQQSTKIPSLTSIEINKTKLEKDESLTQPNLEQITTPKENISRIPVAKSFEDTQKSALITETKIPILKVPDVNSNRLDKINIVDNNVEVPKAIGELFRKSSVQDFKLDEIMKRSSHGLLQPSSAKIEIPGNATSKLKEEDANVHKVKSDVFEEALVDMERPLNHYQDTEEFKDSEQDSVVTIEETIHEEIRDIHLTIKKSNPQIIGGSEIK